MAEQEGFTAHARGREAGLGASVTTANNNDIKSLSLGHRFLIRAVRKVQLAGDYSKIKAIAKISLTSQCPLRFAAVEKSSRGLLSTAFLNKA